MLVAQVLLVRSGRSRFHRRVGQAALPLAVAIWASGIGAGVWATSRDLPKTGDPAYANTSGTAFSLTAFLLLMIGAVAMRRRPDWHKRLVLLATVVVLWPAFFRFRQSCPKCRVPTSCSACCSPIP